MRPIGRLAAPDGNTIHVAARGQERIVVIDTRSWHILRRLPAGQGPDGLAFSVQR